MTCIDLFFKTWKQIGCSGPAWPSYREGHASLITGKHFLIMGGLKGNNEAIDDCWCLDVETYSWKKVV